MKIKKLGNKLILRDYKEKLYYVLNSLDSQLYKDVNTSFFYFPCLAKYYNSEQVSLNRIAHDMNDMVRNQFWNDCNE